MSVLLVILSIAGIGVIVLLALLIATVLEVLALAKTVRREAGAVASEIRAVGTGIGDRLGGLASVAGFFAGAKAKPRTRKKE